MDKIALNRYKDMLIHQESQLEHIVNRMKANGLSEQNESYPTELSGYDNHPADLGSEMFQVEMDNALMVHEEHLLKEVHDALGRIEEDTFGKCAFCGKDIDAGRLEAVPYARLCLDCEEDKAVTSEHLSNNRPVEELVWDAPMGRKYLNKREDDEYEGLDYLNDVVKHGSSDSPQDMGGYHEYEEFYTNEVDRQGVVDDMDRISNEQYKRQLPD